MKILLLITKAEIGGAQMSVLGLARELKKSGHDVSVGFGQGDFLEDELAKDSIPCFRFKNLIRTHNPLKTLAFVFEFKKFLNTNAFNIIHINSSNALSAGLSAKLAKNKPKTVFTFRGLSLLDPNYNKNKYLKNIYKIYFKFFLRFIDEKVFVSKFNFDFALKNNIVSRRPTSAGRQTSNTVIVNGIDLVNLKFYEKDYAQKLLADHLGISLDDKLIIGSIGRLCYAKNYEFLITIFPKILKHIPNAILIIIGDGEEKYNLLKLTKKYNLKNNIFFCGSINNASKYIKAFDIFTLPSRYEGLSITLIEALNAGLPILASKVGGNNELLDNSEAQLFELNHIHDYVNKLMALATDEELRKMAVENNLVLGGKFDIVLTTAEYVKIYKLISN